MCRKPEEKFDYLDSYLIPDYLTRIMKSELQPTTASKLSATEEAAELLRIYEGNMAKCLDLLNSQFSVIQGRSQLLLTLGTVALTITGFSGPKIAESSTFSRLSMTAGILLVLISMVLTLIGTLGIRWSTQFKAATSMETLTEIITYRNRKTRLYEAEIIFLVVGLVFYVASVMAFFLHS
ncbi:MAG TPA: hypothetical protein DET40_06165 [Lentisphaeria bacterium]|nr:MAG: hypothetical protein A2X45_23305 [Lentisphaerae bacterium GWF2_50_93]HCE43111.1 hypothetical protein [Lentisphaeria bacterium]